MQQPANKTLIKPRDVACSRLLPHPRTNVTVVEDKVTVTPLIEKVEVGKKKEKKKKREEGKVCSRVEKRKREGESKMREGRE